MITNYLWEETTWKLYIKPIHYLLVILGFIITVPLDILLLPFELVAFILYKINKN